MSATTKHLSTDAYFARDYGNNLTDDFGTIATPDADEVHAARLTVAAHAWCVDEAREFLEMLGLVETTLERPYCTRCRSRHASGQCKRRRR